MESAGRSSLQGSLQSFTQSMQSTAASDSRGCQSQRNEVHLSTFNNNIEPAISGYQLGTPSFGGSYMEPRKDAPHLMDQSLEALSRNLARLNKELSEAKHCIKRRRPEERVDSEEFLGGRRRKIPKSY